MNPVAWIVRTSPALEAHRKLIDEMNPNEMRPPALAWRRSSYCQGGECAEIAKLDGMIALRNSTVPGAVVRYTVDEWRALVQAIKADEFADLD